MCWVVVRFMGVTVLRQKEHWGMPQYVVAEFTATREQAKSMFELFT